MTDVRETIRDEILGRENFKPIKISAGRPHFTVSRFGVALNVGAMKALEMADHVRVLIDEAAGELMLLKCDAADEFCVELHANTNRGGRLFSKELQAMIGELVGFDGFLGSVRVEGRRVPGAAAVIFDLKEVRRNGV